MKIDGEQIYEVEKRAFFNSQEAFEELERKIATDERFRFVNKYIYTTFLFKEPEYLRIRLSLNQDTFEITKKKGTYYDVAREETNEYKEMYMINDYIQSIKSQGFHKCVAIKAESHTYAIDELIIAFNSIEHLGMFIEVEGTTKDQSEIPYIESKIQSISAELNLQELDANVYSKMVADMHEKETKNLDEHVFVI